MSAAVLAREKKDEAAKAKDMDACRNDRYHSNTRNLLLYTHSLIELRGAGEEKGIRDCELMGVGACGSTDVSRLGQATSAYRPVVYAYPASMMKRAMRQKVML